MKHKTNSRCRAMTLIEVVLTTSIMATVVTSAVVIVRTAHTSWLAYEQDMVTHSGANAVARHIVRQVRQAVRVVAISGPTDNSGSLTIESASGDHLVWNHNASLDTVNYGVTTASNLLAEDISELTFIGYKADGTTSTTTPEEVQAVQCVVAIALPSGTKTVTAWVWMRSW